MSEEQLSALFAKLKEDTSLEEKLKGAADIDAAVAICKQAGFDVSKADWLKHQAKQTLELSDEELETVSGGRGHGMNFGAMPVQPPAMPQGNMDVTSGRPRRRPYTDGNADISDGLNLPAFPGS
jgi:predicted ribosomally synthesized peptide with nif11-like leader